MRPSATSTSPHVGADHVDMIAVLLLSLIAYSAASPTTHIVMGSEATPNSHPYIGSLQRGILGFFWSHICGCSLIQEKWCLTAAHCVDGASASSLRVRLGEHSLSTSESTEQVFGVARIVSHPNYNGNAGGYPNDIALLELNGNADTDAAGVRTITLAPEGASYEGNEAIIAGWGLLSGGGSSADRLQEVSMTKISNSECTTRWSDISGATINDRHICIFDVQNQQASACNGDSGGPMIAERTGGDDVLIGVTSWGISNCGGDYPSVYTRVSMFVEWIEGITGPL